MDTPEKRDGLHGFFLVLILGNINGITVKIITGGVRRVNFQGNSRMPRLLFLMGK